MPLSTVSEEKGPETEIAQEPAAETESEEPTPSVEEEKKEVAEEKEEEEKEESIEEESLPDDKKEETVMETKPTELIELASAPRENVIGFDFVLIHDSSAIWHPGNLEEGTLPHEMIIVYRTGYGGYQVTDEGELKELFFYPFKEACTAASWDPLHTHLLAVAFHSDLKIVNISDNSIYVEMDHAHSAPITCMEYNPNRPSTLCTGAKDGVVTVWHVSHHGITVEKSFQAHTHW